MKINQIKNKNLKEMWLFLKENENEILEELNSKGIVGFCFEYIIRMNEWELYAFVSEARKFHSLKKLINYLIAEEFMETIIVNDWECTKFSILPEEMRKIIDLLKIKNEKKKLSDKTKKPRKTYINTPRI